IHDTRVCVVWRCARALYTHTHTHTHTHSHTHTHTHTTATRLHATRHLTMAYRHTTEGGRNNPNDSTAHTTQHKHTHTHVHETNAHLHTHATDPAKHRRVIAT